MNIRGKSSPVQSNIRTVSAAPARGPTPPPAQIRSHFEEPSHYQSHYQAATPYQQAQPAYAQMSKPTGPGPQPTPQAFSVAGPQHTFSPLVADAQEQPAAQMAWNAPQPQNAYYLHGQNAHMRPHMQTVNNGQVTGSNLAFMPGMPGNLPFLQSGMTPPFSGTQAVHFVQNPSSHQYMGIPRTQFSYQTSEPYQQRMYAPMQQPQMNFMQTYGTGASSFPTYYQPSMQMASTSRPSSAGPQAVGSLVPKQTRNRKMLSLTDPNTGEDITDKVFNTPATEEMDPNAREALAHRNAVTTEFARKVAILAKDTKEKDLEISHDFQSPVLTHAQEDAVHPVALDEMTIHVRDTMDSVQNTLQEEYPIMNGEPCQEVIEQFQDVETSVPCSLSAAEEFEQEPQLATDVQTPSPVLDANSVVPIIEPAIPVNVIHFQEQSPPPMEETYLPAVEETYPPAVEETYPPAVEETYPPAEEETYPPAVEETYPPAVEETYPPAVEEKQEETLLEKALPETEQNPLVEMDTMVVEEEDPLGQIQNPVVETQNPVVHKQNPMVEKLNPVIQLPSTAVIAASAATLTGNNTPGQDDSKPIAQAASGPAPLTLRQDGRKQKKSKKDLNKKSKEGSDMDAFYDIQTSKEGKEKTSQDQPVEVAVAVTAASEPPPVAVSPAEANVAVVEPQETSPAVEAAELPHSEETFAPRYPSSPPEVKVEEPPTQQTEENEIENEFENEEEEEEDEEEAEKTRPRHINGVQLNYKEGQWSPANPEGKKQYDREFLLKLQANPESRKPPSLPDMPEILVDPRMLRMDEFQKGQASAAGWSGPDFTPGFFKSTPRSGGSMNKRGSQQGRRGGQASQGGEQRIIPSLRQEITLHKSENAYKPLFQAEAEVGGEEKETLQVLRAFKGILNKLTPEKYQKLSEEVMRLSITTEERLCGVTDLIFEKAIAESKFAKQYAYLCRDMLKLPKVPRKDKPIESLTFRAVLLTKCQKEFESDTIVEGDLDRRRKELETADEDKRTQLTEELEEATSKARYRSMGNIRFIGELYRLKMLTENIMHDCIFKLLKIRDDDSIECLTKLLETIGKDLDHPKAKHRMDQYFAQFEKMTADMSEKGGSQSSQTKAKDSKDKLCTRVKFSVLEIIDMRKNNWVMRKIHDQNKPTTLEEIHQKAKQEQQEQQFLNSQPRVEPNPQLRGAKGKGRGALQGDIDGWNTVATKPVRQQIDATKMKITKTNVDETTLTLGGGNKFQSWSRGSQGGGSRSQEQDKSGNRYNALNSLNDNDGRRGYGRSPGRGDSRSGAGRIGERDRRDRERDFRKPVTRSSIEAEKERAVTSTRTMLGAGTGSNPSSRNASRDNSRSRDMPPAVSKVPYGPDASQMSPDELERRLTTIAEELHINQNIMDAKESITEINNLDYANLVTTMLEKLVEKAGKTRKLLGQLLFELVKEQHLSIDSLISGIAEFIQYGEDLELDVPKIWDNLAEIFAGLVQDNKVLPLSFLQTSLLPLVKQGNGKEAVLVHKIMKTAADYHSKEVINAQWASSGLKLSDFKINERTPYFELSWLKEQDDIFLALEQLLRKPQCSNDEVFRWIESKYTKEVKESDKFIRAVMGAICKSYYIAERNKVDLEGLKSRIPVLRKYLDDDKERGTQALFGVQRVLCDLQHPPGLVRTLFDFLYDEDIISEESFFAWERRDGSPDEISGKGVVMMNVQEFFEWLRSAGEEDKMS